MNVLTHTTVSNVRNTTILSYIRIAGNKYQRLLRLKQPLQGLRKRVRLLQNQGKEATAVLRNSVHPKFCLPWPVKVTDSRGIQQPCRVLLDGGSQSSYITEDLAQRLQLKRRRNEMPITGINNTCSAATHSMDIKFSSKDNKYSNVTCFILPNLMGNMPSSVIDITTLKLPKDIILADDEFNIPGRIDMIGSDLYPYLMKNGRYTRGKNHPVIQETHLSWILHGRIPKEGADKIHSVVHMQRTTYRLPVSKILGARRNCFANTY